MRILHLITHFDLGGAERVAANIAASTTEGMEYHVVEILRGRSDYTTKFISELRAAGVQCHRSWMPDISWHFLVERIAALLFPLRMLYIMLRLRPDVVHTHTETPDLALYVSVRLMPWLFRHTRIVRTIHNTRLWTGLPRTARWVERMFVKRQSNVAISDSVRDAYAERFGSVPPIIHNGVSEVPQHPWSQLCQGKVNILFAGRLEPQKGVRVLCDVLRMLSADSRFFFTIAGDGSERPLVEQTIAGDENSRPLTNARLVPPIYGLAGCLASFDYLFMPSEFEGLSMLSMEASMNRLPVIANDAPGLRDTLPPDWPLMAHANDTDDYRRIFGRLCDDAFRTRIADRAQQYARANFSIRGMQQRYEEFYAQSRH